MIILSSRARGTGRAGWTELVITRTEVTHRKLHGFPQWAWRGITQTSGDIVEEKLSDPIKHDEALFCPFILNLKFDAH